MADYNNSYQPPNPPPPYYPPPGSGGYYPTPQPPEKTGMSVASMVLGIIGIVFSCCSFISGPCAVIGLILGIVGIKRGGKGMAITGIVLCSITLLCSIVGGILLFGDNIYSDVFWDAFWDGYYY